MGGLGSPRLLLAKKRAALSTKDPTKGWVAGSGVSRFPLQWRRRRAQTALSWRSRAAGEILPVSTFVTASCVHAPSAGMPSMAEGSCGRSRSHPPTAQPASAVAPFV